MKAEIGSGDTRRGLSPVVAFVVVAALAIAGSLVWLIGGRDSTAEPTPNPPDTTVDSTLLTEAEAITEFQRLYAAMLQAVEAREIGLLEVVVTSSGTARENLARAIRDHLRDGVIERSRVEFLSIELQTITANRVVLSVSDILFPCFVDDNGNDISKGPGEIHRRSTWTVLDEGGWRLHRAVIEDYEEDKSIRAHC